LYFNPNYKHLQLFPYVNVHNLADLDIEMIQQRKAIIKLSLIQPVTLAGPLQ